MPNINEININNNVNRVLLKLKLYRELANINQNQIATLLSMSSRTYQRIEAGDTTLDLNSIYKLSHLLNINL